MIRTRGFSLVELVIIILIVGILAAFAYVSLPDSSINVDAQAKLIANDIRYAQSLATAKSERYTFITLTASTYQIKNSSGSAITFAYGGTTQTLNAGIIFKPTTNLPNNLVTFDGDGIPYYDMGSPGSPLVAGTTYSFQIGGGSNNKTIGITPLTGRVYIQ